jgi:16S rRNA (guanine966-N2)-methyltransferase
MRIIAGERKGHTIFAPKGLDTRPTSDRVRENVFNIVAPWVEGARVLDLYAGSGAMGLEALSRGASRAVFVERDDAAARTIEQNLDKLRLPGTVLRRDAVNVLAAEAGAGRKYDLVLVDPPYDMYTDLQPQLARYLPAVLAEDGLVVVETDARVEPELPLAQRTSRKYGSARITVYEAS